MIRLRRPGPILLTIAMQIPHSGVTPIQKETLGIYGVKDIRVDGKIDTDETDADGDRPLAQKTLADH